jgi:uncharacterized protein HemY
MKNAVLFRVLVFLGVFFYAQVEIIAQTNDFVDESSQHVVRRAEVKKKLLSALSAQKFGFLEKESQAAGLSADQSALKYLTGARAAQKMRSKAARRFKKS